MIDGNSLRVKAFYTWLPFRLLVYGLELIYFSKRKVL